MENSKEFEIHIKPSFNKFYSESNNFGIYSATVENDSPNQDLIEDIDEFYRDINITGSMPRLEVGNLYVATVISKTHEKYGQQYEVKTIYQKPLTTREEQIMFIGAILTPFQVDKITEAYPTENLIDLIRDDKMDISLIKGIGEKTYEKIKKKIEDNDKYQLAIIELTGKLGVPYNAVRRLSDKYGSPDLLLQKIKNNPYLLTEVDGFGFKRVDEIALQMGVDKKSPNRIKSCIEYLLDEHANNGHCWMKYTKVVSESVKMLNIKISDVEETLKAEEGLSFKINEGKIYSERYYEYELRIHQNIKRLLESQGDFKVVDIEDKIKKIEENQGFEFTEEQLKAIDDAIKYNIIIINGKAGSGKTSLIKGVVEVLKSIEGLEYATCALSGKASQRIQESTGLKSSTMHRLLGYNPNTGWGYDEDNQLGQDVIILDEASMVNSQLFFFLIRSIKSGAKLIITGDDAQLSPIGVGNVFYDLLRSEIVPKVELTKVHRQAQKSGILSNANLVRDGINFTDGLPRKFQKLGELEDLFFYPKSNPESVYENIIKISKSFKGDILDYQVIVPMKNRGKVSTGNLNNELQKIFNADPKDVDEKKKIERKNYTLLEGDKVIMRKNNYDKDVFNGTIGIVEYINLSGDGEIVIDFDGVGRISFKKDETLSIELAYALTAHSTQGSQWEYVLFALTNSDYILLDMQIVYTAMTRASKALMMTVEIDALKKAIRTDNSSKRNTFLSDFLSAK